MAIHASAPDSTTVMPAIEAPAGTATCRLRSAALAASAHHATRRAGRHGSATPVSTGTSRNVIATTTEVSTPTVTR